MALQGKTDQYQIVVQLGLKENLGKYCVVCVVIFTGVISSVYSVNALALQKNIGLSHGEAVW